MKPPLISMNALSVVKFCDHALRVLYDDNIPRSSLILYKTLAHTFSITVYYLQM